MRRTPTLTLPISAPKAIPSQIAASSQEQARGVSHITEAISRIEQATQSNAEHAHRTAEVAKEMEGVAGRGEIDRLSPLQTAAEAALRDARPFVEDKLRAAA